ncbi:hypothetical protein EJ02DRAFT_462875 [Clathrospora elynae]|uniref:Uncharacterized protein n=1 Tax=Clathrospora elynae TaxID=706981 RepID=A0A6A5T2J0_9PLEO|nr:hypothetical protein EJ02DRAFT_462875 [Clathrospora elynae]
MRVMSTGNVQKHEWSENADRRYVSEPLALLTEDWFQEAPGRPVQGDGEVFTVASAQTLGTPSLASNDSEFWIQGAYQASPNTALSPPVPKLSQASKKGGFWIQRARRTFPSTGLPHPAHHHSFSAHSTLTPFQQKKKHGNYCRAKNAIKKIFRRQASGDGPKTVKNCRHKFHHNRYKKCHVPDAIACPGGVQPGASTLANGPRSSCPTRVSSNQPESGKFTAPHPTSHLVHSPNINVDIKTSPKNSFSPSKKPSRISNEAPQIGPIDFSSLSPINTQDISSTPPATPARYATPTEYSSSHAAYWPQLHL